MVTINGNLKTASDTVRAARRIVIKVGSSLLMEPNTNEVNKEWLKSLATDIKHLIDAGKQVVIVSSGAVALGIERIGLERAKAKVPQLQAAASIGQIILMRAYADTLARHDLFVSQVLLTLDAIDDRRRYINSLNTLNYLLKVGAIPIVNENDTTATAELRYGDNDRLAARVAQMVSADVLILLSNVNGLYRSFDGSIDEKSIIPVVEKVTEETMAMASSKKSPHGSGGMKTKLEAASIATESGCVMIICDGRSNNPIDLLLNDGLCTWFKAEESPVSAKKQWILNSPTINGVITIDDGAVEALMLGNSLLAIGIIDVQGTFGKGETISIVNAKGDEIARGLCTYACHEIISVAGKQSDQMIDIIGYYGPDEIVHRDNMALVQ
jgi:glutamate 5-kinase